MRELLFNIRGGGCQENWWGLNFVWMKEGGVEYIWTLKESWTFVHASLANIFNVIKSLFSWICIYIIWAQRGRLNFLSAQGRVDYFCTRKGGRVFFSQVTNQIFTAPLPVLNGHSFKTVQKYTPLLFLVLQMCCTLVPVNKDWMQWYEQLYTRRY